MSSRSHSRCASVRGAAVFALLTMVLTAALLIQALEPLRASADGTADEADLHFRLGNEAYRAGDFSAALEKLYAEVRGTIREVASANGYAIVIAKTDEALNLDRPGEFTLSVAMRPVLLP